MALAFTGMVVGSNKYLNEVRIAVTAPQSPCQPPQCCLRLTEHTTSLLARSLGS